MKGDAEDLIIDGGFETNDISYSWTQQNDDLAKINQAFPINKIEETMKERELDIEFRVRHVQRLQRF